MLSVHKEKHRLIWVVHDHPSLVFTTQSVQALLLIVSVMKFKLGLSGQKTFVFFLLALVCLSVCCQNTRGANY